MDLEELKNKIDIASKNMYLFQTDRKRYVKKLKKKYDLEPNEVKEHLEHLEEKSGKIVKKINRLKKDSEELLRDVKDAIS